MEELLKKYDHLDEKVKKRIKNYVKSKNLQSSRSLKDYKNILRSLESQINQIILETT